MMLCASDDSFEETQQKENEEIPNNGGISFVGIVITDD